jgi:hypothetical protein
MVLGNRTKPKVFKLSIHDDVNPYANGEMTYTKVKFPTSCKQKNYS